jgi:hypothetical protein
VSEILNVKERGKRGEDNDNRTDKSRGSERIREKKERR